jgi:hypothetical protein
MTDTVRTQAALLALGTEGVANSWSYQDQRDFIVSAIPSWWTVDSTPSAEQVTLGGRIVIAPSAPPPGDENSLEVTSPFGWNEGFDIFDVVGSDGYVFGVDSAGGANFVSRGPSTLVKVSSPTSIDFTHPFRTGFDASNHAVFGICDALSNQQTLAASPTVEAIRAVLVAFGFVAP